MIPAGVKVTGVVREAPPFFNSQRILESVSAEKFVPINVTAFSRREGMRLGVRTNGAGISRIWISMQAAFDTEPTPMQTPVTPAEATLTLHTTAESEMYTAVCIDTEFWKQVASRTGEEKDPYKVTLAAKIEANTLDGCDADMLNC